MTEQPTDAVEVLRAVWAASQPDADSSADSAYSATTPLGEDCGPTKSCRNMKDVSFDGFAPEGTDLRQAWRQKLEREGKLSSAGNSIRDLVLGPAPR